MLKELAHAAVWAYRHQTGRLVPTELATIAPWVAKGDTCVDVGAHGGAWLFPLSRMVGPGGAVIGFEALPYYARVLGFTRCLLGRSNASILNVAVTEDGSMVRMVWQDPSGSRLTGRTHIAGEANVSDIEIAGITLDAACANVAGRISFLKIDIEGAELGALRGGIDTLRRHRPIVLSEVVEQHLQRYGHSTSMLFDFFDSLDYRSFVLVEGRPKSVGPEQAAQFNDVLFVPNGSEFADQLQLA
jgi:FkbM family methyltransferase